MAYNPFPFYPAAFLNKSFENLFDEDEISKLTFANNSFTQVSLFTVFSATFKKAPFANAKIIFSSEGSRKFHHRETVSVWNVLID